MVSFLHDTLVSSTAGKFDVNVIQRQLDENGREFDRLLCLTGEEESEFLDRKIKKLVTRWQSCGSKRSRPKNGSSKTKWRH